MKNWDDLYDNHFKKSDAYRNCLARNLFPSFWNWLISEYPNGIRFDDSDEEMAFNAGRETQLHDPDDVSPFALEIPKYEDFTHYKAEKHAK